MKCIKCNYENPANVRFCAKCGAPFVNDASPANTHETAKPPVYTAPVKQNIAMQSPVNNADKKKLFNINVFSVLQMFMYLLIATITIAVIFIENGVNVNSLYNESYVNGFTISEIIKSLIVGSERVNPTAVSIVMGVSSYILIFGSAFFWLAAFIARLIKKPYRECHTMALIFTGINVIFISLLVPLAIRFSGMLRQLCAHNANMLLSDVGAITSVWAIVFSILCIALVVTELIFVAKEKQSKDKTKER